LQLTGAALFLTLVMQDPLILSQHTHIPMQLSHGEPVLPFSPKEQEVFTRSLLFPLWFSRWILINLDAHELHHVHTSIPGYYLHKLGRQTQNGVSWWRWLLAAKRVPGDVFLYQNRNQTGFDI
jgi:fatty acid desaturase